MERKKERNRDWELEKGLRALQNVTWIEMMTAEVAGNEKNPYVYILLM